MRNNIQVIPGTLADIPTFVAFSYKKRRSYEEAQPQFWRYAGPLAEEAQAKYFEASLKSDKWIVLKAMADGKIVGFIMGSFAAAPPVYNPGGLTLWIDDFCVELDSDWNQVGAILVNEIKKLARPKAAQILVVSGGHDEPKRSFLKNIGLSVASEFYVGDISLEVKEGDLFSS